MNDVAYRRWREFWLTLGVFFVATLPLIILWRVPWARGYALMVFFLGCTVAAAKFVSRELAASGDAATRDSDGPRPTWGRMIAPLAVALIVAAAVFSAICWIFRAGVEDPPVAPMLAFMSIVPVLGITPYFVLRFGKLLPAVVFTVALVGGMKLLGCLVVVLIYGWDADEQGRLGLPWDRPDLLVWLFWSFTAALSLTFFLLAARRFREMSPWTVGRAFAPQG